MIPNEEYFNVFIGSTTGALKGVTVGKDTLFGIRIHSKSCMKDKDEISNKNEITCMSWANKDEQELLVATKNTIKIFNTKLSEFTSDIDPNTDEVIRGLHKIDETYIMGLESGVVKTWKSLKDKKEFKVGSYLECMKLDPRDKKTIATGGKENDLKTWNIETGQRIFNSKNVKPDSLQLPIPIWVSDISFFQYNENIATCTRHGYVRLYDPLLAQRRPVKNVHMPEQVFTCMSPTQREYQVIVGSGTGDLHLVDLRGKGIFAAKYKGFAGAVKSVTCPNNESLVITTSLDRHFRIHDINTRKLLVKEYMQSRLTTSIARSDFKLERFECKEEEENDLTKFEMNDKDNENPRKDTSLDDIFSDMPTITGEESIKGEEKKKKRKLDKTVEENDKLTENIPVKNEIKKIKWKNKNKNKNKID